MDFCQQSDVSALLYDVQFCPRFSSKEQWLQSFSAEILEPKKIKSVTSFHFFSTYLP